MFRTHSTQTSIGFAVNIALQIFHASVRNVRQKHRPPILSLVSEMMQSAMFVMAFLFFFQVLGLRGSAIRGDFLIYIMTCIFHLTTHTKAVGAGGGAEGSTAPMMQHAPMNLF